MRRPTRAVARLGLLVIWVASLAQADPARDTVTLAAEGELMSGPAGKSRIRELLELAAKQPSDPELWFELGKLYHGQRRFEEALDAYARAEKLRPQNWYARYNAGCAAALAGRGAEALMWLEKAIDAGFAAEDLLQADSDFRSLHGNPRFDALLDRVRRAARPCESSETHRRLDFLLGEWEVRANDRLVGVNRIQRSLNGCAVVEQWDSAFGADGRALAWVDPVSGRWRQSWVDSRTGALQYAEVHPREAAGELRLVARTVDDEGRAMLVRQTLHRLDDGRVRQQLEESLDGGREWRQIFDAYYTRKGNGSLLWSLME